MPSHKNEHCPFLCSIRTDDIRSFSLNETRQQAMYNAEKRGKRQVLIRPVSKVVIKFLQVMQKHGTYVVITFCVLCVLGRTLKCFW